MLTADVNIPNERLIGSICSKLYNLRKHAPIELKPMIKEVNNSLIGYLATNKSTYENCDPIQ